MVFPNAEAHAPRDALRSGFVSAPNGELHSKSLGQRLIIAIVAPLTLLVAVGLVLTLQIVRMNEASRWLEHSQTVIGKIYEAQKLVVDQETGLRGFLLTSDRSFLEPYERARPLETLDALGALVVDDEFQSRKVAEARRLYEAWIALSAGIARGQDPSTLRPLEGMRLRKNAADAFRASIGGVLDREEQLRRERSIAADAAARSTRNLAAALSIALLVAIAWLTRSQLRAVVSSYSAALTSERGTRRTVEAQNWLRTEQVALSQRLQGEHSLEELGTRILERMELSVGSVVSAFYTRDAGGFRRRASIAPPTGAPDFFPDGVGLVGDAARKESSIHLKEVPGDYLKIEGGIGERSAVELFLLPARVDGRTYGVVELGFLHPLSERAIDFLERSAETLAISIRSIEQKMRLRELLEESQRQTEELQTQQEELRVANEELHEQSEALRNAQAQLEERKEELEASNASLESQRDALERAQKALAEKATSLAVASRYKSEFLANMSHELRTPLNSSLILAKLLADNREGNLTEEQVKYAATIYTAGNDLLVLINDILDLSKIEAGRLDVHPVRSTMSRFLDPVRRIFDPVSKDKGVELVVECSDPELVLETDVQRGQQVVKNLLSNAFKFTSQGRVVLRADRKDEHHAVISVTDSGIGIPKDQQEVIFEAFRQADGTTNRRFGGTGLGLSISRDLAQLLGGDLTVESEPGKGSTFTLVLPLVYVAREQSEPTPPMAPRTSVPLPALKPGRSARTAPSNERAAKSAPPPVVEDGKKVLLIVDDDVPFAKLVGEVARDLEYQIVVTHTADEAIRAALDCVPSAIILDLNLPDHSGLSVLDRLKREEATRHIPVHILSAEDYSTTARSMGAVGYTMKPVTRDDLLGALGSLKDRFARLRRLLIVEDDTAQRDAVRALLQNQDVDIVAVGSVEEALSALKQKTFDCVVTDLALGEGSGYDLIDRMASSEDYSFPPVIVYTGRSLTSDEEQRLRRFSTSIIVKGARSPERLLDEVTLFLHQVESELPPNQRRMLREVRDRDAVFEGRTILVAEDDVRNVFALTSVLEPRGAKIVIARNGHEAIAALEKTPRIDLVLMDIMMPEMDGLQAIKIIRSRSERWSKVPVIALTAKAMQDDQERCLSAGANDYIPKPLDVEMLVSLIRVWMRKE